MTPQAKPSYRGAKAEEKALFRMLDKASSIRNSGDIAQAERTFRKLMRKVGDKHELHYQLGLRALHNGVPQWAYEQISHAVELAPDVADYGMGLAKMLIRSGKHQQALIATEQVISRHPRHPQALENRAMILCEEGRLSDAVDAFSYALEVNPDSAGMHNNQGVSLRTLGRFEEALSAFDRSLELKPIEADVHFNRGLVLRHLGRDDDALASFDRALELRPEHVECLLQKALLLEEHSRLEEAEQCFLEARQLDPRHGWLTLAYARLRNRLKEDPGVVLKLLEGIDLPAPLNAERHLEMGLCYDRLQDGENAFAHFSKGKQIQSQLPANRSYDKRRILDQIRRLREVFLPEWIEGWTDFPLPSGAAPVFILGFPRSGTTLLDRILSGHPQVQVIEEQPILEHVFERLDRMGRKDPDSWSNIAAEQIVELRDEYLAARARYSDGAETGSIWIDKMPLRSIDAGLVYRLFPDARFIFALRHPCDVVLSCLMQNLELNDAMINFCDLGDAANLYDEVMSLWEQYERLLPLRVHYIRYEDVVEDTEKQARDVISFLGLDWHDSVLDHTKTARTKRILTPSYTQVTQPIYRDAKYRWLRYRRELAPVLSRLKTHAERFGYGSLEQVRSQV